MFILSYCSYIYYLSFLAQIVVNDPASTVYIINALMSTTIQLLIVKIMQLANTQPAPPTCKLRRVDSLAAWLPGDRLALQDGRKEKAIAQETLSTTTRSAAI